MAINILLASQLRDKAKCDDTVQSTATNVSEMLVNLVAKYPEMRGPLFDGDKLRRSINVFVNGEDTRFLDDVATPLKDGDEVSILPAFAGG